MPTFGGIGFGGGGGGIKIAGISGGTVVDYTEGSITWRQHELRSTSSLTIDSPGYVDTIFLIAGGGSAGSNSGQYTGGGGGGGGFFLRKWGYIEPQTISATIGGAAQNSSVTIQGYGTVPGDPIVCGAGARGGNGGTCGGGGGGFGGSAGSNGGGNGGSGGRGGAPSCGTTGGTSTVATTVGYPIYLGNKTFGNGGGSGANTGNGASAGSNGSGGSGIFIIRYPIIDV